MRTGTDGRFHFCYRTTNRVNGRTYVGKRTTDRVDDGYLGSGVLLALAIKKYGRENFTREIIEFYDDSESAFLAEVEHIRNARNSGERLYNVATGGTGTKLGPNRAKARAGELNFWYGKNRSGETNPMYGKQHRDATKTLMSASAKSGYAAGRVNPMAGKEKTKAQIDAIKAANCRDYDFIDPHGCHISVTNLAEFCKTNGLNETCMRHVSKGRNKSHKGWTNGRIPEADQIHAD